MWHLLSLEKSIKRGKEEELPCAMRFLCPLFHLIFVTSLGGVSLPTLQMRMQAHTGCVACQRSHA